MKPYLLLFGFLFIRLFAFGQSNDTDTLENEVIPAKLELKYAPFEMLPLPLPSFQWGIEHRLENPRHSFLHELGWLFPFPHNLFNSEYQDMQGIRLRSGYRHYLVEPRLGFNFYVSGTYTSQFETWDLQDWFDIDNGAYQRFFDYRKNVWSNGLVASVGSYRVGKFRKMSAEWELGIGGRVRSVFNKDVPSGATGTNVTNNPFANQFNPTEAERSISTFSPIFLFTFRMGFILK